MTEHAANPIVAGTLVDSDLAAQSGAEVPPHPDQPPVASQQAAETSVEDAAPMIDVHPPHQPVHTWKDFLIHMSAICLGLLIAIGLEQTVEYIHHRFQAREARASIQQELTENASLVQHNLTRLGADKAELAKDMDVLNSNATDAQALSLIQYSWYLLRQHDAAWNAAKTDGSIALIAPRDIGAANYFYSSSSETLPVLFAYMADMETAAAIVDHARIAGRLDQSEREQLRLLTASSIGRANFLYEVAHYQSEALKNSKLNH